MKKFIVTITSILMLFTTSLVSTFASAEAPLAHKPTLEDVEAIYNDIFYNYEYDEEAGKKFLPNWTMKQIFEYDVKFMEKKYCGSSRQFDNLLVKKLTDIGIKAVRAIIFVDKDSPDAVGGFVLYELDGKKYVADPVRDKIYKKVLGATEPTFFQKPLDDYLKFLKDEAKAYAVIILKDSPQNIDKCFNKLVDGVDGETIFFQKS